MFYHFVTAVVADLILGRTAQTLTPRPLDGPGMRRPRNKKWRPGPG